MGTALRGPRSGGTGRGQGAGPQELLAEDKKAVVITEVARPPKGQARWTVRRMARQAGMSVGTVHALWRANDLKPHRTRT